MSSASFVTATLWGKTSRPAPRVSTLVPFICIVLVSCWVDAYILQESIYATILLGKDDNRYGLLSMLHSPLRLICMFQCPM